MEEFAELHPMDETIWYCLTESYLVLGRVEDARATCNNYIALCPDCKDFRMLLLKSNNENVEGNHAMAMEILRKCARLKDLDQRDRNALTYCTACTMCYLKEPKTKVIAYLKRMIRAHGSDKSVDSLLKELQEEK